MNDNFAQGTEFDSGPRDAYLQYKCLILDVSEILCGWPTIQIISIWFGPV